MEFPIELLGIVVGFMVLANRLVAALITPIFDKYVPETFRWLLMYVAWGVAGAFVWWANINLFEAFIPDPLIGKILTAVVAGGGSNLLHDLTDKKPDLLVFPD